MSTKIFYHIPDDSACTTYRATIPLLQLYGDLSKNGIYVNGHDKTLPAEDFDIYIFNRLIRPDSYREIIEPLIKSNKKLVWQCDDDLWQIPEWNPVSKLLKTDDLNSTSEYIKNCKFLWVSTTNLSQTVDWTEKTRVLPNLVDINQFDEKVERNANDPIKILWAGSASHHADFDETTEAVLKIAEKHKEKIAIIFWGYLPTQFAGFYRQPGLPYGTLVPRCENIFYGEWFSNREYFYKLTDFKPDIAIMPLSDCPFNYSKCIIGDSLVVMTDGLKEIKEITNGTVLLENNNQRQICNNFKYTNQPTLKICTNKGYEIEGTLSHKIKDVNGNWKKLEEFNIGDKIIISPFVINASQYQWFAYPLLLTKGVRNDLKNLLSNANLDMLPRIIINEKWGQLLGILIGDGYLHAKNYIAVSSSTDYSDFIEHVENLFKSIGVRPRLVKKINSHKLGNPVTKEGKGVDIIASSQHLVDILNYLGFTGKKCKIFEVPKLILQSPKSVIKEFLRGLFETDGKVESCGCSFTSKSKKLASQVHVLLLGFGIMSNLVPRWNKKYKKYYYYVELGRQAADIFHKEIGFISLEKIRKLSEIISKPHSNAYKEWQWEDEISVIEKGNNDVYDIEVKEYHYYLANGFVNHNSNIKYLEMSMAGAACIATDLPPYDCIVNNETGVLVKTPQEWFDALDELILNKDRRLTINKNACEQIKAKYTWQSPSRNIWLQAFLELRS